jgi:hypothetical protein
MYDIVRAVVIAITMVEKKNVSIQRFFVFPFSFENLNSMLNFEIFVKKEEN